MDGKEGAALKSPKAEASLDDGIYVNGTQIMYQVWAQNGHLGFSCYWTSSTSQE